MGRSFVGRRYVVDRSSVVHWSVVGRSLVGRRSVADCSMVGCWSVVNRHALRVAPAVIRLTVYRRLQVGELGARCRQRECVKSWEFFVILSKIHTFNFSDTCFLAQFNHVSSACNGGLLLYAL